MVTSSINTSRNQASPTACQSTGAQTSNGASSATRTICSLQSLPIQEVRCKVAETLALYDSNPLIVGLPYRVLTHILNAFVSQVLASKLRTAKGKMSRDLPAPVLGTGMFIPQRKSCWHTSPHPSQKGFTRIYKKDFETFLGRCISSRAKTLPTQLFCYHMGGQAVTWAG